MTRTLLIIALAAGTAWCGEGWMAQVPAKDAGRGNPLAADAAAAAAGRKLYGQYCAACHGAGREGTARAPGLDGTAAAATDGQLFWLLRNGLLKRGMPSWSHLPPQQRWQIITYLKKGSGR